MLSLVLDFDIHIYIYIYIKVQYQCQQSESKYKQWHTGMKEPGREKVRGKKGDEKKEYIQLLNMNNKIVMNVRMK